MDWFKNIQVLKRPDGNFALWTRVTNDFIHDNITGTFAYKMVVKYALTEYHARMEYLRQKGYYGRNPVSVARDEHRNVVDTLDLFRTVLGKVNRGQLPLAYKDHPLTYEEAVELAAKHG